MDQFKQQALARALLDTGVQHPLTGRPVYIDPEGYPETEKNVTIQDPRLNGGAYTNVPSIWGGQQMTDPQWAANNALISGQTFPSFNSIPEADAAAVAKSRMLGATMPQIPGMDPDTGQLTPFQMQKMWQRGY